MIASEDNNTNSNISNKVNNIILSKDNNINTILIINYNFDWIFRLYLAIMNLVLNSKLLLE